MQGNLPVSATETNGLTINLQGLPYNPPFAAPIQNPRMQQYAGPITGYAMLDVVNNATKHNVRCFYYNLLSLNNWQNQEFIQLCNLIANIADYLILAQRMHPEQAISQAAGEASMCYMANIAINYQAGLGGYMTQPMVNDIQIMLQRSQQWNQQLNQFQMQVGQQQQMGVGHGMQQMNYGQQILNGPNWLMQGQQGGGMMNQGFTQRNGMQMGQMGMGGNNRNTVQHAMRGNQSGGMFQTNQRVQQPAYQGATNAAGGEMSSGLKPRKRQDNTMLSMAPDGTREVDAWNSEDGVQGHFQMKQGMTGNSNNAFDFQPPVGDQFPTTQTTIAPPVQMQTAPQSYPHVANPERPYDSILLKDGQEVRDATVSGWTKTFNIENPYRLLFNPAEYVLLHVKSPDGKVSERLEPRTEEMDYMQHELNPRLREQERQRREANGEQVVSQWDATANLRQIKSNYFGVPVETPEAEVVEGVEGEVTAPPVYSITTLPVLHNLQEAKIKLAMFGRSPEIQPDTPIEFRFDIVTPHETSKNYRTLLHQMECVVTFEELLAKLYDLRNELDEKVVKLIDERVTAAINAALPTSMSVSIRIDSFIEDYKDLLQALREDGGNTDVLADQFANHAPEIIGQSLSVLTGDDYDAYLKKIADLEADENAVEPNLLVFRDRTSITQVPWTLEQINLGNLTEGGAISADMLPEIHAAVDAIYQRTPDYPVTFARRYIQTSDDQLIELRQGYLNPEAYLMFLVK